jgi:hypothetical protein
MQSVPVNGKFEKKGFIRGWILANILGLFVGALIVFGLQIISERYWSAPAAWLAHLEGSSISHGIPITIPLVAGLLVGNLLTSRGEQIIIRRQTNLSMGWFQATAIGFLIGAGLFFIQIVLSPIYLEWFSAWNDYHLIYAVLGPNLGWFFGFIALSIDLAQWLVLRKTIPGASNWIWIRILSSICFFSTILLILLFVYLPSFTLSSYITEKRIIDICYVIRPPVCDISKISEVFTFFIYFIFIFAVPIAETLSALIRGLFIMNRLKEAAHKLGISPVSQAPDKTASPAAPE